MTAKDVDELVSIELEIGTLPIKFTLKNRLLGTLQSLLSDGVELLRLPGRGLKGRVETRQDQQKKFIEAAGDRAAKLNPEVENLARTMATSMAAKEIRAFENKLAVIQKTIEYTVNADQAENTETSEPIDQDWLNVFEKYAEVASSEELRDLWARVLAREIKTPESISLRSMRIVSEISKNTAENFYNLTRTLLVDDFCIKERKKTERGLVDKTMIELEASGLVKYSENGHFNSTKMDDDVFIINGKKFDLIATREKEHSIEIRVPGVILTNAGKEIYSILDRADEEQVFTLFAEYLPKEFIEIELRFVEKKWKMEAGEMADTGHVKYLRKNNK